MRDDNYGPVGGDIVECLLDDTFSCRVQGACCFVQQKYSWVGYNASCDREALLLPAREHGSSLADMRIIPLFCLVLVGSFKTQGRQILPREALQ